MLSFLFGERGSIKTVDNTHRHFDKLEIPFTEFDEVRISAYYAQAWRFSLHLPSRIMDELAKQWCEARGIGVGHVKIEVRGGVAEVTECSEGVEVSIVDWDNKESGICPFCDADLNDYGDQFYDTGKCPACGEDLE